MTDINVQTIKEADIKEELKLSKDYKELYYNAFQILNKMEENFTGLRINYVKLDKFNGRLDKIPESIFDKKAKEYYEKAQTIVEKNGVIRAGISLATMMGYQRVDEKTIDIISKQLYDTQEKAINDIKNDAADGLINQKNNISIDGILKQGSYIGSELFYLKEYDQNDFYNRIKALSDQDLYVATFCINEGYSAFEACYKEIKTRLGANNVFDVIDGIVNKWDGDKDQIKEFLYLSSFTSLLGRGKIQDFITFYSTYSRKSAFLNTIYRNRNSTGVKEAILQQFDGLQKMPDFKNLIGKIKDKDSKFKLAIDDYDTIKNTVPDVLSSGKFNGLLLFDNEGDGGGAAYFQPNIESFKKKGFTVVSNEQTSLSNKVVLQKGADKVTLILLKCDSLQYNTVLSPLLSTLKTNDYNFFALRGHCFSTDKMALDLGKNKMVGKKDILLDGGCRNANKVAQYRSSGVNGLIFAYTGAGKGAASEGFTMKILEQKENKGDLGTLLNSINAEKGKSSNGGYFADNTLKPDSAFYSYLTQ